MVNLIVNRYVYGSISLFRGILYFLCDISNSTFPEFIVVCDILQRHEILLNLEHVYKHCASELVHKIISVLTLAKQ